MCISSRSTESSKAASSSSSTTSASSPSSSERSCHGQFRRILSGLAHGEAAVTKKQQQKKHVDEALHYSYYYRPSLAGSYRAPGPHATTSSSSECSSYGGFSSSEAESSNHRRLRPIRTVVPGGQPAPAPEKKAKKPAAAGASIRAKLTDLRKPASPGARLAGFLNTIFAGKRSAPQTLPSARAAAAEYACSSASSYSRSCLSKTPSTRGPVNRTVRFVDGDREAPATVPGADRQRVPALAVGRRLPVGEAGEDAPELAVAGARRGRRRLCRGR
ncbi:protein BIG GRAIN 1-like [Hordeum vulgare subsp. vulgare]|uniref:Uncharacterized protein n=1 Tax=Hordeum vulgare subsp. vulgare TaxID=112509 RepID=A0A8I7BAH1_HORVV|nr:protein BIG GRAIN 1-like [Hordeum vulgare subsp. vulgare]